jgi:hypothetical protein
VRNVVVVAGLVAAMTSPAFAYHTTYPCRLMAERCVIMSNGDHPFPASRCTFFLKYALKEGVWASNEARALVGLGPSPTGTRACTLE